MRSIFIAACFATASAAAVAGTGDVYVPAHRTANGLWVPANVPPSSGGTVPSRKIKGRATPPLAPAQTAEAVAPTVPPLFVAAKPIRR